jgi:hypothetical protein
MLGPDGFLRSSKFSDISAIGVVSRFNPSAWKLDRSVVERLGGRAQGASFRDRAIVHSAVENDLSRSGSYRPEASEAYLSLLINLFADYQLDHTAFQGPYDERWDRTGRESPCWFDQVWVGPAANRRMAS